MSQYAEGLRRVSLSRLQIAEQCTYWLREDVPLEDDKPSWATRLGSAFHSAVERHLDTDGVTPLTVVDLQQEYSLTPRHLEHLGAMLPKWKEWAGRRMPKDTRPEVGIAYNPLTHQARIHDPNDRRGARTLPGEWYGIVDGVSVAEAWFVDWKTGAKPLDAPHRIPQVWGLAPMVALAFGLGAVKGAIVQVTENSLEESASVFGPSELGDSIDRMEKIALRVTPDAEPVAGERCRYCRAKPVCPAHQTKPSNDTKEEEKPIMTTATTPTPQANGAKPAAAAPAQAAKRPPLTRVRVGPTKQPVRIVAHGEDKIGKTTFANGAPDPYFIGFEGGLEQIGPARYDGEIRTFSDVLGVIDMIRTHDHSYRSLVLDPLSWLEPLIFQHVCRDHGKANIEEVGGGFQKGYVYAVDHWERLLRDLDAVRAERGMNIILLCHTVIRNQKNPAGADWGSYQISVNAHAAAKLRQWADAILFMQREEFAHKGDDKRVKGRSTGARLIHTTKTAAWDAGNRFDLPETLPLSWREFWLAVEARRGRAAELKREIFDIADALGTEVRAKAETYVSEAAEDVGKLEEVMNALRIKQQETAAEAANGGQAA